MGYAWCAAASFLDSGWLVTPSSGNSRASAARSGSSPRRKRRAEPSSRGLSAAETGSGDAPAAIAALQAAIEQDGGTVLRAYREPLGGHWQILAVLPTELVQPTPYQRDLSPAHVLRLADRIQQLDRFLDPIVTYRVGDAAYWTPNGHHRLEAMRRLGARSIVALVMPDEEIAYKILALNTAKAHNLREKSLEAMRMARGLAQLSSRPEKDYELEFEEPALLTLGLCYEKRGRFAGGAYHPMLKRVDRFSSDPLAQALAQREERAAKLLKLDDEVGQLVSELKQRGFESPYLRAFVVARLNPLRFKRGPADFDETLDKMLASAGRLDPAKIKVEQLARTAGAPAE